MITEMNRVPQVKQQVEDKTAADSFQGKVLVADDDMIDQRVIATTLSKFGLDVTVVSNGSDALNQGLNGNFDLLIIDMMMPDLDGCDVVCNLRDEGIQAPIVALTGNIMKPEIDACLASGYSEHLAKPVDREHLSKVLEKYLVAKPATV